MSNQTRSDAMIALGALSLVLLAIWLPYLIFGGDLLLGAALALTLHKLIFS